MYETEYSPKQAAQAALDIWNGGACNPRAVARALVKAIDCSRESGDKAPALLIMAQLAFLMGASFDSMGSVEWSDGGPTLNERDALARCEQTTQGEAA